MIRTHEVLCVVCGAQDCSIVGSGCDFEYATCKNTFSFVRCDKCGHHYLSPRPDASELGVIYPANYGNYSNSQKPSLTFRIKNAIESRTLRSLTQHQSLGFTVLDVGCGDGRLIDNLRSLASHVGALEGIEISAVAAQAALAKGYPVHIGTLSDYQKPSDSFDLIFLIQVIEHVEDPRADVRRIFDLLRPGGRAIFETPSTRCLDFALFKRRYWGGYHFPRHFNLFDPSGFSRLLLEEGYVVESIRPKLQPVHWVWTFHHFFKEYGFPNWWTRQFHIKNPATIAIGSLIDLFQVLPPLRRSSNMQIIARKPSAS